MKKAISLLAVILLLTLNEPSSFAATSMPKPFHEIQGGGSSLFLRFSMLCSYDVAQSGRLDSICMSLINMLDDINEFFDWTKCETMDRIRYEPVTSLMEYHNMFSFIVIFNIPIDEFKEVMEQREKRGLEAGLDVDFTQFEIDLIATLDESRILEHFASDYVILHDGRAFPPAWIYWHDIEAYEAAGITQKMIEEKLHLYAEFSFTAEATFAFEEKLSEFLGRDVVLAEEQKATYTTADALAILRHVAGLDWLTGGQFSRLRISGGPQTSDALRILRIVAGLHLAS
jgi:hypothetical protein